MVVETLIARAALGTPRPRRDARLVIVPGPFQRQASFCMAAVDAHPTTLPDALTSLAKLCGPPSMPRYSTGRFTTTGGGLAGGWQLPAWHVSPCVHIWPSLHVVPFGFGVHVPTEPDRLQA